MNEIDDLLTRFAVPVPVADDVERIALAHARTRLDDAITRGGAAAPRRRAGAIGLTVAVATALAIALAAVLALRSHPGPRERAGSPPVQARALVAQLAVLRRPATRADIEPVSGFTGSNWRVVQSMTRLARTVRSEHGSLRIYLLVEVPRRSGGPQSALVAGFAYGRGAAGFMLGARTAASLATPGPVLGANQLASIVPDKVAHVRWVFGAPPGHPRSVVILPSIRGNVAYARAAPPKVRGPLISVTWYDAHGHVIGTNDVAAQRRRAQRAADRAIARSDRQPVAPSLLSVLGVLRRPPTRPLPHDDAASLAQQGGFGINVSQARFVRAGGRGFWIVPGSHGICLVGPTPGALTECGGLTGPGSPGGGGFAGGSAGSRVRSLDGIAPDGDASVTVVLADGTVKHVPVVDNVYSVTIKGRFKTLIVRASNGRLKRTTL